jgi:hypothetical protein
MEQAKSNSSVGLKFKGNWNEVNRNMLILLMTIFCTKKEKLMSL